MEPDELRALISKTAELMESYRRHSESTAQRQQAQMQVLRGLSEQIPAVVRQEASSSLNQLNGQVIAQVHTGLERPTSDYEQRLHQVASQTASEVSGLAQQIAHLRHVLRLLIWKMVGAALGALLLLLGGGIWLSTHYAKVIDNNQVSADLMTAYNRSDVVLCGNGQLCANVDTKAPRYGDHRQYALVRPR